MKLIKQIAKMTTLYKRDDLVKSMDKKVYDENGQEIKEATLTRVGDINGVPLYTNPTVEDGIIWCINESNFIPPTPLTKLQSPYTK